MRAIFMEMPRFCIGLIGSGDHDCGRLSALATATKKSITDMMERAVKAGFYEKMPDAKIIYAP